MKRTAINEEHQQLQKALKFVTTRRAAVLLGISEEELRRISHESGFGRTEMRRRRRRHIFYLRGAAANLRALRKHRFTKVCGCVVVPLPSLRHGQRSRRVGGEVIEDATESLNELLKAQSSQSPPSPGSPPPRRSGASSFLGGLGLS